VVAVQEIPVLKRHVTAWIAEYAHAVLVVDAHTSKLTCHDNATNTPFFQNLTRQPTVSYRIINRRELDSTYFFVGVNE
jgi:hypothetical protein